MNVVTITKRRIAETVFLVGSRNSMVELQTIQSKLLIILLSLCLIILAIVADIIGIAFTEE